MLAIPMMSAECERVFSSAKHLITDSRNRLRPDIIEANECLKHWFGKLEQADKKPKADQKAKGSEEPKAVTTSDHEAEAEDEEAVALLADMDKGDESDVEDGVYYEVDSDGEVVWKD
jgi:phage I-like protein